ncbi:MAG TPA: ABC transporter permease subunit [Longimicrobium sp.]|jgi:ABC-2 type transport system permease protein
MILAVERALASVTARQILARRRALVLAAFGLSPVLIAALFRRGGDAALTNVIELETMIILPVILPIIALVIATGVFGAEIDDGTALYVLSKPVARWRIVLTRVLVAAAVTTLLTAPAALLVVPVAGVIEPRTIGMAFAVAVAVGALLYSAVFVALSLVTRRALVAGLVYVVVWEGIIATQAPGARYLSIIQFILTLAQLIAGLPDHVFDANITPGAAAVMSVVFAVGAVLFAIRRLRAFEVGEAG